MKRLTFDDVLEAIAYILLAVVVAGYGYLFYEGFVFDNWIDMPTSPTIIVI